MERLVRNIKWIMQSCKGRLAKRDYNTWVFGEWFGKRCCDNCMYLANYIAQVNSSLNLVWIAQKNADLSGLHKNIKFVEMDSPEAKQLLGHAGVFVVNQGIMDVTDYDNYLCTGAIILNLWHGFAWKRIGLDQMSGLKRRYYKYIMHMQRYTYYLAQSEDQVRTVKGAFGIKEKQVLRAGSPRNTIFYDIDKQASIKNKFIEDVKKKYGVDINSTSRIVTYMPTFRDKVDDTFTFESILNREEFVSILEREDVYIIQKLHFAAQAKIENGINGTTNRILQMNDIPAQELLAISDMLITDYSSCFLDFMLLDRPIVHYIYDYEYYANKDRGLYYDKSEIMAGDAATTVDELITMFRENLIDGTKCHELRQQRKARFMAFEGMETNKDIYNVLLQEVQKRQK